MTDAGSACPSMGAVSERCARAGAFPQRSSALEECSGRQIEPGTGAVGGGVDANPGVASSPGGAVFVAVAATSVGSDGSLIGCTSLARTEVSPTDASTVGGLAAGPAAAGETGAGAAITPP